MHEVSRPLRRAVIDFLLREQEARGVSDVQYAAILGMSQAAWSYVRNGHRSIGLEFLCRAVMAFPPLLTVVISFFASLVKDHHQVGDASSLLEGGPNGIRKRAALR